jgi:hypothetical protein
VSISVASQTEPKIVKEQVAALQVAVEAPLQSELSFESDFALRLQSISLSLRVCSYTSSDLTIHLPSLP